jgi:hypothetical protein
VNHGEDSSMPLPEGLRTLIHDRAFWSDFLDEDIYRGEYPSLVDPAVTSDFSAGIRLAVTANHTLTLSRTRELCGYILTLTEVGKDGKITVAADRADGHPHRYGLRWQEVDLFGRCLALRDPEWYHPGLAVLFLSLAAPVTSEDDASLAFPLLRSAWQSLGLFRERQLAGLVRRPDRRSSDIEWCCRESGGWELRGKAAATPRHAGRFDHGQWGQFVAEAEQLCRAALTPQQVLGNRTTAALARAVAEEAEWGTAPILADALEESGIRHSTVLAALRSTVPAQVLWVLELGLGLPFGRLIKQYLGSPVPPVELSHRLEVQFPADADPRLLTDFKRAVFEGGLGSTYFYGGCWFTPEEGPRPEDAYDTTLVGNLDEGLEVIRRVFTRYGPPPGTGIYSRAERRHLPLAPGSS